VGKRLFESAEAASKLVSRERRGRQKGLPLAEQAILLLVSRVGIEPTTIAHGLRSRKRPLPILATGFAQSSYPWKPGAFRHLKLAAELGSP
jgi:hypothetical protein